MEKSNIPAETGSVKAKTFPTKNLSGADANGLSTGQSDDFAVTDILIFLWIWRYPLFITTVLALVLSAIFSSPYFIKPKFKSTVILFPTTGKAISKSLLSENPGSTKDILEFGDEEQCEQMLQILNSNEIRNRIIQKYNLLQHYEIDTTAEYPVTDLYDAFEDNIRFKRTEYMSLKIEIFDHDPIVAAKIANDIAALLDTVRNRISKERAMKGLSVVENEYNHLINDITIMEDSLQILRYLGVHDYEAQSQVLNEQYAIALAKDNQKAVNALNDRLTVLARYGGAYVSIRDRMSNEKDRMSILKTKLVEARVDAEHTLPHKFVVDPAYPAEKKSYPIRWLIILVSTFSSFVLCVITILLFQKIKLISVQDRK